MHEKNPAAQTYVWSALWHVSCLMFASWGLHLNLNLHSQLKYVTKDWQNRKIAQIFTQKKIPFSPAEFAVQNFPNEGRVISYISTGQETSSQISDAYQCLRTFHLTTIENSMAPSVSLSPCSLSSSCSGKGWMSLTVGGHYGLRLCLPHTQILLMMDAVNETLFIKAENKSQSDYFSLAGRNHAHTCTCTPLGEVIAHERVH